MKAVCMLLFFVSGEINNAARYEYRARILTWSARKRNYSRSRKKSPESPFICNRLNLILCPSNSVAKTSQCQHCIAFRSLSKTKPPAFKRFHLNKTGSNAQHPATWKS